MNEDFIPFELAVKLKEKGFDVPFYFYYRTDDKSLRHANITNPLVYCDKIDDEVVIAPTISQVLKWLREKKKIFLEIVIVCNGVDAEYMCDIYKINPGPIECLDSTEYFKTYEQAALAGIEYVLDKFI